MQIITKDIDDPQKLDWLMLNKEKLSKSALTAIISAMKVLDPEVFAVRHFTIWRCGLGDPAAEIVRSHCCTHASDCECVQCCDLLDNQYRSHSLISAHRP